MPWNHKKYEKSRHPWNHNKYKNQDIDEITTNIKIKTSMKILKILKNSFLAAYIVISKKLKAWNHKKKIKTSMKPQNI